MTVKRYTGCVYVATCCVNGKKYVGKTIRGLAHRRAGHEGDALKGVGYLFSTAMQKHGSDSFDWEEVFLSDDDSLLRQVEIEVIKLHRKNGPGVYNLAYGGEGATLSESSRKLLSEGKKGWCPSAATRANMANGARNRKPASAKTRAKISAISSQHKHSDEVKARIGAAISAYHKRRKEEGLGPVKGSFLGRKHTEETKAKISAAKIARRSQGHAEVPPAPPASVYLARTEKKNLNLYRKPS